MTDESWSMVARHEGPEDDADERTIQLSDGSIVALGADTRVEIEYGPVGREVMLDFGRAEINVIYRAGQEFKVWIGRVCVSASVGRFEVILNADGRMVTIYPQDCTVEVAIYPGDEGALCDDRHAQRLTLGAFQIASFHIDGRYHTGARDRAKLAS